MFPFVVFLLFPVLVFLLTGELVLCVPMYLPMIHDETLAGFSLLSAVHVFWFLQVIFGLIGSDFLMGLLLLHILPMVELFELSCAEMNEVLDYDRRVSKSRQIQKWLRNITQMHQAMTK